MENEVICDSIVKERHTCDFFQVISFLMTIMYALLPIYAIFSPENHGVIFKYISFFGICGFVFFGGVNIILKCVNSADGSFFENLTDVLKTGLKSAFSNKHGLLLLFVYILSVISALFAPDKVRSFFGTDFRPDGVLMYTSFAVAFIFASCIKKKCLKNAVLAVYIGSFMIISLIMVQQYFGIIGTASKRESGKIGQILKTFYDSLGIRTGHFYKGYTGSFYNLNHMGYYTVICSMLITGLLIKAKGILSNIFFALLAAYSYCTVIMNDTFGAYIAILAASVLVSLCIFVFSKNKNVCLAVKLLFPVAVFVSVSIGFSYFSAIGKDGNTIAKNISTFSEDVKNVAKENGSKEVRAFSGRWPLWSATVDMIRERPLAGYGADNLKKEYTKRKVKMDRAHCEILETAVSSGIPAAIFYVFALLQVIFKRIRDKNLLKKDDSYLPFLMAVVGYCVSALVGVFLFYTAIHFMIMIGMLSNNDTRLEN